MPIKKKISDDRQEDDRQRAGADDEVVLTEKLKALARLSDALSHKISNLLTSIVNYSFIIKNSSSEKSTLHMLEKIEDGVNRVKEILHTLADAPRRPGGGLETLALDPELKGAVTLFCSSGEALTVNVKTELHCPSAVRCARGGLRAVISSVLRNAVEAGASEITIGSRKTGDRAMVIVSDNGAGIKKEYLHMVFEPFFTTKQGNIGLGLYLSYHIMNSFGGAISCLGIPGGETGITISFPAITPISGPEESD